MSTPEGLVKAKVKRLLAKYGERLYSHWPVMNGMGEPTLDCNGAINGRAFSIECKAPGKVPTDRQYRTIEEMQRAGVQVFVVDGSDTTMNVLVRWLDYWIVRGMIEEGI